MATLTVPTFRPHRLFPGGLAQTLAGAYLPYRREAYRARRHQIGLDDGDQLVLHDDCPPDWQPTDRSALLIHGLGGCHESGYMVRLAHKLCARGVRAFRMDLRGCGAGMHLARLPYHSGRSEDAAAALVAIARHFPHSPTTLVGFSLGANIALKLLGELGATRCGNLDSAMAVCPPVDLAACSRHISRPSNRLYDRYFVNLLLKQLAHRQRVLPQAEGVSFGRRPRTLWEFDNAFTAVVCGFGTADNYYRAASSAPWIPHVRIPTFILASCNDPMIPVDIFERVPLPGAVQMHLSSGGGHLGFVSRPGTDPDCRWMEWRVVDWVTTQHAGFPQRPGQRIVAAPGRTPA
jgi:predicted alpha/beta-fold hydrolase